MIQSAFDVLTPLQKKAFKVLPAGRNAYRQLFIEYAPTEMLDFCVTSYESGTSNEQSVVSYIVNDEHFGFRDRTLRDLPFWTEQDADLCDAYRNCLDLIALAAPYLPLKLESAVNLISGMSGNMRRYGMPCTRENQRARFLLNVITFRLPSRTKILDSYRKFISDNRVVIEKNIELILERKLYQPRDIRTVIDAHPVLVEGVL